MLTMEEDSWDLTKALEEVIKSSESLRLALEPILRSESGLAPQGRQDLLDILSDHLLDVKSTVLVASAFGPLLLELFQRAVGRVCDQKQGSQKGQDRLFVASGKHLLTEKCGIERASVLGHLGSSSVPFQRQGATLGDPPRKKRKTTKKSVSDEEIVMATFRLVEFDRDMMSTMWDWDNFGNYLSHKDKRVVWYACQTLAGLNRLGESEKETFLAKHLSPEDIQQFAIRSLSDQVSQCSVATAKAVSSTAGSEHTPGRRIIYSQDLSQGVVSVCGVLLSKTDRTAEKNLQTPAHQIVPVPSTRTSLQSLALAVVSGSPVLLEGPVGSGKTSYVEHVAHLTGRQNPSGLIKVQLGDQTDSKALVGTYRCTEIPGEFVWQPGPLTQAVLEGKWILLEDLDYAPMDVISVLLPLLESGSLTIPGHGDMVRAAPGFQIFATQRLYSHQGGLYRQQSTHSAVLDHCWTKVKVNSLSRNELLQVITKLYPTLEKVAEKLLEIFLLLCASDHETDDIADDSVAMETDDLPPSQEQSPWKQRGNRSVSTRDLLKWCDRISGDHDLTSSQTGNMIFQEALDCFSSCLPKPEMRLAASQAIGALINIPKEQARYFCQSYKPAIEIQTTTVKVGRIAIPKKMQELAKVKREKSSTFSFTQHSLVLLERIASCILRTEPVLLVGETGTGKTSTVQYLAELTGQRLKIINMNQQSDSTDLLGGYKPVDIPRLVGPVREEFEKLFVETFSRKKNIKFLGHVQKTFHKQRWQDLLKLMDHTINSALEKRKAVKTPSKKDKSLTDQWKQLSKRVQKLRLQVKHAEGALAFTFVEGTLVRALHDGDWILLDEINLASAETLECLSSLLEGPSSSLMLMEKGDLQPVVRHPDFRLFACMNPATDIGKKELPMGIRNRFTEFFVDELVEYQDLKILICDYLKGFNLTTTQVQNIVTFYTSVRALAKTKLMDGTGHHPHFSLRTLCRALGYAATNPCGSVPRSLYESFSLSFLTQLDKSSCPMVRSLILKHIVGKASAKGLLQQHIPPPAKGDFVKVEGYWVASGQKECTKPQSYIITPSVRTNLKMLSRIVSARRFPVLLQGETSVGKTSLIQYLAQLTGNTCVRVNNHEHTDLQEYVGFYAADETGKLVFKEGVLVDAMRKGFWIILDELNLAPSDVLEALNRLLDDNRELFIPETQETVTAHPGFMLFATQNPPGQYGGRKILSRAFRNRFVELHFDEIPSRELETILHGRCAIPQSYSQKMVAVMLELQLRRKGSGVFAGKSGFMTLRDLFRWAERYRHSSLGQDSFHDWDQHIADEGYLLLAGKVRHLDERDVVKEVLQQKLKRTVNTEQLFTLDQNTSLTTRPILEKVINSKTPEGFEHLVWTSNLRRLAVLVGQALKFGEPVLLVGETGCGKTTICQLFSELANKQLFSVNCHLHTETSDFLGGLRPVRSHTEEESKKLFEWCDGPLVLAMRQGCPFLIDEISLADDSVLERLNSVLEPEQKLLLAERGSSEDHDDVEEILASEGFHVTATMNPGGDFGKKELSPALRNRFTEIWCEQSKIKDDLVAIIEHNIRDGIQLSNSEDCTSGIGMAMMEFIEWFKNNEVGQRSTISVRDLLSWVNFINTCSDPNDPKMRTRKLEPVEAFVHGACLVFLDGLGVGPLSAGTVSGRTSRQIGFEFLQNQMLELTGQKIDITTLAPSSSESGQPVDWVETTIELFGIPPFYIPKGPLMDSDLYQYTLSAPTTALNALRLLRALQLPKAILLEGSPGVGKTSLVTALAKSSGNNIVRINLSEQTDVTDLFGADLPVEGGEGGQFAWRDGPLLQALKAGHWIVLDELNLASQSVLEGLNACLDHRGEVFVPELGKRFEIQREKTRIFACQNPLKQGGGRKGLPKSFLNRFTQVYMEPLGSEDLLFIASTMYSDIPKSILQKMVEFSQRLCENVLEKRLFGQRGGPWEFNLRDLFRWCDLMIHDQGQGKAQWDPGQHMGLVYAERLRLPEDREQVLMLFKEVFGDGAIPYQSSREFFITPSLVQVGNAFLPRDSKDYEVATNGKLHLLHHDLRPLESLMKCLQMNWMAILVGPSASGKSTLAKLAAALTGHPLKVLAMNSAMDTTELLGGFEQTDLYRHYERLKTKAEKATILLQGVCLRSSPDGLAVLQAVQSTWSLVCSGNSGNEGNDSNLNPVEAFKEKLKKLDDHLVNLKENSQDQPQIQEDVDDLLSQLQLLTERVAEGDKHVLGGGGQFEWVDGLLVQALLEGDWLLIDNVNFCSPSVLDRLNGLLEPNGVLTINERGIIDGEIPTIKPHPNFRLILAMDPKYGQISRAMRNRGLEICVAPEPRECDYSYMDMMTLLKGLGLNTVGSRQLIKIHSAVKEEIHDVGSISSLLLAASLTQEYQRTGRDWSTCLKEACTRVYVTSQLLKTNQVNASKILEKILTGKEAAEDLQAMDQDAPTPNEAVRSAPGIIANPDASPSLRDDRHVQLPSVGFLRTDSALAMVRRDTALVKLLSQNVFDWKDSEDGLLQAKVQHGIFDVLSRASYKDHSLRQELLSGVLSRLPPSSINLDMVRTVLDVVFQSPLFSQLRETQASDSEVKKQLQCLPVDLYNNPQVVDFLMYCTSSPLHTPAGDLHDLEICGLVKQSAQIGLRFHLMMWRSFLDMINPRPEITGKQDSPLKYSEAFASGHLSLDDLPHPAFAHLSHFFKLLSKQLDSLLNRQTPSLTEASMLQVKICYQWLLWFRDVCHQPIVGRFSIGLLALHWGWVQRKTLDVLMTTLGGQERFPLEFEALVDSLDNSLGLPAVAMERIWKSASASMHLPSPSRDEEQAHRLDRLNQLAKKLEITQRPQRKYIWRLLKFLKNNSDVSYQVLRLFWRVWGQRSEEGEMEAVEDDIGKLEKAVAGCLDEDRSHWDMGELGEDGDERRNEADYKELQIRAMMLPVQELVSLRQMHREASGLAVKLFDTSKAQTCSEEDIHNIHELTTFVTHHCGVNSRLLLPMYSVVQDQSLDHCLWTEVWASTLASLQKTTALISPGKWRDLLLAGMKETLVSQTDLPRNPALLLIPLQALQTFDLLQPRLPELLTPPDANGLTQVSLCDPVISKGIPLGCWRERLSQLQEFSRITWVNSGWMNSTSQCYSKVMMKSLSMAVCWLVSSLKSLVSAESEASWDHCMNQLKDLLLQASDTPSNPSPLLQDTISIALSLLTTGSQSILSSGQSRSSAKMLQGLSDFHSELLKWTRKLLENVVDLTALAGVEAAEGESANQKAAIRHFQWLLCLGRCWMCHGYLQSILLAPREPVDPAQKTAVKLKCVKQEIEDIEAQLYVKMKRKELLTGQKLELADSGAVPERVRLLNERLEKLKKKEDKLTRRVAYRPQPPQYDQLREDIAHFLDSIGSPSVVEGALENSTSAASVLTALGRKRHQKKFTSLIREMEGWRRSQGQFLTSLEETYPMYRDLWAGMAAGAYGVAVGSQFIQHGIEAAMNRSKLDWKSMENESLEDHLSQMAAFPFTSSLRQAESIIDSTDLCQQVFSHCYHGNQERSDKFHVRLTKLALLHATNHVDTVATIDDTSNRSLQRILGMFVDWWHRFEEERKWKEEEEASLFKYKTRSHGSDETPEETEAREMKEAFPSYDKDFADIDVDPTKDPPSPGQVDEEEGIDSVVRLDDDTQRLIQGVHQYLYTHPRPEITDQTGDLTHVMAEGYKCSAELFGECLPWMAPGPDAKLVGAHLIQCKVQQDTISGANQGHRVTKAGKPFDIYHDPSPSEVIKCLPLLTELADRVDKLMEDWPDHPALKHLKLVVLRIESFPVNAPLMKFLLGLEMVLTKAQDWQEVAAKHVSLQKELGKITELVIEWRKMELSFWSSSLDSVAYNHRQGVVKWWFHLYQVIENMTSDPSDNGSHDGEAEDWLSTLQKFLEGSTLGDFQARLKMVLAFHYQVTHGPTDDASSSSSASILWNLYRYYKQFVPGVEAELAKQRKPLEKELKEFVKICRWNDINFWAMKAAVDKSHKTVHKICKKFQTTLEGPAKVVFTDLNISGKGNSDHEGRSSDLDSTLDLWVKTFNTVRHPPRTDGPSANQIAAIDSYIATTFDPESLMSRLHVLSMKVKRYCKELVKSSAYEEATISLDDFGGEIVSGLKELQSLDITKDADKKKQKSEAKHINLRKRKALSELYKALTKLGLSYRKGLVMKNENLMAEMFSLPKIEAKDSASSVGEVVNSQQLLEVLETKMDKAEYYFFLNHARKAKLLTALENPSKELGLPNLERCKGFSEHLSRVTLQQRKRIGDMSDQIQVLSDISSQLCAMGHPGSTDKANQMALPPQTETEGWLERSKELLDQALLVISQYQILLQSCPANQSEDEKLPSPVPSESLSTFERMTKESGAWLGLVGKLKSVQNSLQALKPALNKRITVIRRANKNSRPQLLFWSDIDLLDKSHQAFEQSIKTLAEVLESFWMESHKEYASTADALLELKNNITETVQSYQAWQNEWRLGVHADKNSGTTTPGVIDERLERLLSGLLLAVQTVTQQNKTEGDKGEQEDEIDEVKNSLTELLGTKLATDMTALELSKIIRIATSLISDLRTAADTCQVTPISVGLLLRLLPIMQHYQKLASYYFSQLVATHKSSCKLLYVLLGIFNELAEKGFCLPAEFSDELSGEGATDFEDIQGAGIDDGEGVKDVSDQIEDEEQVQDVKREGEEEKENQNQDDIKDEKEGIEMTDDFEGKLQDMEPEEVASDDEDGVDQDELDKQMGDVDKDDTEKLDEKMWGDEEDPEQEEQDEREQKEEHGDGDEEEEETQLVAKDDNQGDNPEDKNKDKKRKEADEGEDGPEAPEPKALEQPFDQNEINDDEIDPSKANDPPAEPVAEDFDLPDDLDLEGEGEEEDDLGEEGEMEENPLDIERPPTPIKEMDEAEESAKDGEDEKENGDEQEGDEQKEMEGVEEEEGKEEDQGVKDEVAEEDKTEKSDRPEEEEGDDDDKANESYLPDKPHDTEHIPEDAENAGKSADNTDGIQKSEPIGTEEAGMTDEKKEESEEKATGLSETQQESGHEGAINSKTAIATNTQQDPSTSKRKPGHSDTDRSLGQEEKGAKRLKTIDASKDAEGEQPKKDENKEAQESDLYEHLKDAQSHFDAQAVDTATEEQVEEAGVTMDTIEDEEDGVGTRDQEEEMPVMEEMETVEEKQADKQLEGQSFPSGKTETNERGEGEEPSPEVQNQDGNSEDTPSAQSSNAQASSAIHTKYSEEDGESKDLIVTDPGDLETVRREIEKQLSSLHGTSGQEDIKAQKAWHDCEAVTSGLARELCEQLRLVLEPTQASKLRGDYRTGKRINMRKVIPYIASGFRKDKIWLRRTKPSKREYQILLAVDDSSSMADNRSRQMAFESMALVSNALTWLEAGQLAVCSFGESVQLLHPFHEQFSDQAGAKILQEFTFSQKKTKIAQLLKYATSMMSMAKMHRAPGAGGNVQTSQLLLVMSDGRGLYLEGLEKVKSAVRAARDANIFLVFLILDNPENKDSILDIKVPIFKSDGLPDIHSYMEHFPFPFYILLRDINALPTTLSDALRQWFELVTAGDNQ